MCSTCGCKGAESFEAPMTRYDEYCISCGSDSGANSNLCMKCQKMFGVKKASNRMIARLGLGAESFEVETFEADGGSIYLKTFIEETKNRRTGKKSSRTWISGYFSSYDAAMKDAKKEEATYNKFGYVSLYDKRRGMIIVDAVSDKRSLFTKIIYQSYRQLGDNPNELYRAESFEAESLEDLTKDQLIDLIRGLEDREVYVKDFIDKSAESFEAQRKLTDIDRDGKPYTGQIYPDHPDLDPVKADRNKDGYMSSWERALGNQVARGMEKYKSERKPSMKRMSMRKTSRKSTSILPSVIVVGVIAAIVGSKIRK